MAQHIDMSSAARREMLLVSVIVATFNRATLLERTLASVRAQTYPNIEIVVIDDGSTDHTPDIVARWTERSSHPIKYYRQSNRGCASARNKGLEVFSGEFFSFLDSDDAWVSTAAESLVDALRDSPADFVYSPSIEVLRNGRELVNLPVAAGRPQSFAVEQFNTPGVRVGSFMCRRQVLATVHGLDEELGHNEDYDFIQRVAICHRATYSDSPTVRVFHHASNKSANRAAGYRTLLRSVSNILRDHPAFAADLGSRAAHRQRELERKYVDALILANDWSAAKEEVVNVNIDLTLITRVAFAMHSNVPLRMREKYKLWKLRAARVRRAARGVLEKWPTYTSRQLHARHKQ